MLELSFSELTKEEAKQLIAVMLLTDGYAAMIKKYAKIAFYNNDPILHEIFVTLMKTAYNTTPTTFKYRNTDTEFKRACNPILQDLFALSPSFKSRGNTTIKFLFSTSEKVKKLALSIAMSADGSFSISAPEGRVKGHLLLSCINKNLCEEWKKLFEEFGIKMRTKNDSTLDTKIHGIQTVHQDSIINFTKIGFVPSTYVYKGYRFVGFEKNVVLASYCEFINKIKSGDFHNYSKWSKDQFWKEIYSITNYINNKTSNLPRADGQMYANLATG